MFKFGEFHKIGLELGKENDLAHIRSAINRHYYALFGDARQYLVEIRGKRYLKTKRGIHGKVCNVLITSYDPTERYVGELLLDLMKIRGFADYDWNKNDSEYFEEELNKVQKDVKKGLESLEFLKNKYSNN